MKLKIKIDWEDKKIVIEPSNDSDRKLMAQHKKSSISVDRYYWMWSSAGDVKLLEITLD